MQPLHRIKRLLPTDPHVIEGAVRRDGRVVDTPAFLYLALDLFLGSPRLVTEHHVLGEMCQLLLARRVSVRTERQGNADRDHRVTGQVLVPELEAVGESVGLEVGERVGDCL